MRSAAPDLIAATDSCEYPTYGRRWYDDIMSGTYTVTMGDRGRLVVPADLRQHAGWDPGSVLVLFETPRGVVLLTREQLKDLVRADLDGLDLVGELLADRRKEAAEEGAA
jgi:bifunctional DNA-binding transcriptional regulator/antitoxin component of YhaV-PrlF toxin-antitoxin module